MPLSMSIDVVTRKKISSMNEISAVEVVFSTGMVRLFCLNIRFLYELDASGLETFELRLQ